MEMWEKTPGLAPEIPELRYYPSENKKSDTTFVIFAGGAYMVRSEYEGDGYAKYLNKAGYDAFVCEYRVSPAHFPIELLDARRAVRTVRHNAGKYGINKNKIIVIGSSAGGNLCALLSTYTKPIEYEGADEIDNESALPNGCVLCYPVISLVDFEGTDCNTRGFLLGDRMELAKELSPELHVSEVTPPTFIWHVSDDGVTCLNSYVYAKALSEHNIPCEMHIFPKGGHGLGIADGVPYSNPYVHQWTKLLEDWVRVMFDEK